MEAEAEDVGRSWSNFKRQEEGGGSEQPDLSEIIRLSVSSFGESPSELESRKEKLTELGNTHCFSATFARFATSGDLIREALQFESWLGKTDFVIFTRKASAITCKSNTSSSGFDLYGYEVSNMDGKSDYFLAADELIERNLGCWGWCAGMAPSLEELSFILAAKKTGSSLIRIHNAEITSSCTELNPNFRTCVKIVINAETKGVVRLDFPPSSDGMHGDFTVEMIPVAVIGEDEKLVFIFRPSPLDKNNVTEIITADGTAFVVAKVGPIESLLKESTPAFRNYSVNKKIKDHFCVLFLDELLGRSWKELVFSVGTIFFYMWLIHKAYKKKSRRNLKQDEQSLKKGGDKTSKCMVS